MALLIAGVTLWTLAHLFPAAAPGVRANLAGKFGEGPYKGLFAVDIVIALGLIIYGWKTAIPTTLYAPPVISDKIPLGCSAHERHHYGDHCHSGLRRDRLFSYGALRRCGDIGLDKAIIRKSSQNIQK